MLSTIRNVPAVLFTAFILLFGTQAKGQVQDTEYQVEIVSEMDSTSASFDVMVSVTGKTSPFRISFFPEGDQPRTFYSDVAVLENCKANKVIVIVLDANSTSSYHEIYLK